MYESTYVLTPLALSPAFWSPVERVRLTPPTVSVTDAFTVSLPGVELFTTIVHLPLASVVFAGELAMPTQSGCALLTVAPFEPVTFTDTVSPAAGTYPAAPRFFCTVTVKVCAVPTGLVGVSGVI